MEAEDREQVAGRVAAAVDSPAVDFRVAVRADLRTCSAGTVATPSTASTSKAMENAHFFHGGLCCSFFGGGGGRRQTQSVMYEVRGVFSSLV